MIDEANIEPARFAMTGCGIASDKIRRGYMEDVISYSIDAPRYIATGSLRATTDHEGSHYIVTAIPREW